MKLTLNDMFKVYMNNNIKLKPSTRAIIFTCGTSM